MISFSIVNSETFFIAFNKLMDAQLSPKVMLAIKRMWKKIQDENRIFEETRKQICIEHAEKENGEPVICDGSYVFSENAKLIVSARVSELAASEISFDRKIPLEELSNAKLSAKDLLVLEGIIDEGEA